MTSWTDNGRIPPQVSLLESAAPRRSLKRVLGFCVVLNIILLLILELNAHFLVLWGVAHYLLKERRWCETWT